MTLKETKDVSIIIINYNTPKMTLETIESIYKKTLDLTYEILLVDNASTDNSVKILKQNFNKKQNLKLIESGENLGFGKANNLAVKQAKGRYLFLLNPDTLLINNAIKKIFKFLENNNNVGVCGGNLYTKELEPAHSFCKKLPSIPEEIKTLFFMKTIKNKISKKRDDFNYSEKPQKVGYITGADLMIKKSLFNQINGFDKDFFMYYEETEMTNRIKKLGYEIISLPEAKIIHLEGQSFEFKEFRSKTMYESRYKYYKKVYGKSNFIIFLVLHLTLLSRFMLTMKKDYLKTMKINKNEYIKFKSEDM